MDTKKKQVLKRSNDIWEVSYELTHLTSQWPPTVTLPWTRRHLIGPQNLRLAPPEGNILLSSTSKLFLVRKRRLNYDVRPDYPITELSVGR